MRHHYVPQFLLRAWAEGSADGRIVEFLVETEGVPIGRRAPKGTAFEDDLYALSRDAVAGMDKQAIETGFFKQLDDSAAKIRAKLLRGSPLTRNEVATWAVFVMAMRARQPAAVGKIRAQGPGALRESICTDPDRYRALAKPADHPTLEEWTERHFPGLIDNFGMSLLPDIVRHEETAAKLLQMKWGVIDVSGGKRDLLLSDQAGVWTGGIDTPALIIALPISPTKAFIAVRGEQVAQRLMRMEPADLAERLNESSVGQAVRRVYGKDEGAAEFVRKVIAKKLAA